LTNYQSLRTLLRLHIKSAPVSELGTQVRDVGFLTAGNLVKFALGLVTSAIVFRTLGPSNAGRLTLTLGIVGLVSIVGEFGLRDAAVNYIANFLSIAPERAYAIGRTFFFSKVVLSALASAVGIFGASFLAGYLYPGTQAEDLIRLGAFSLLTSGLLAFSAVILEAQRKFALISTLTIVQGAVRFVLVVLLFIAHGVNLYSLLLLEAIVPLAAFTYSLRFIRPDFYALRLPLFEHLGTLFHFTKWIAVAAVASAIFLKLDVLLLSYYRTPAEVGFYAVALALISRLEVFKTAVLTTAFPDACRQASRSELRKFVFRSLRFTGLASFALMPMFVIGAWAIEWIYGGEYGAAIPAFYPLLAGFLVGLNSQPAAFILYPLNRPKWIAGSDVVQLVFNTVVNLILIPTFGIVGAAWGVLLTRIAAATITFVLARQLLWKESTP
jgi:O-antigen/teichoic acid export membrane protein